MSANGLCQIQLAKMVYQTEPGFISFFWAVDNRRMPSKYQALNPAIMLRLTENMSIAKTAAYWPQKWSSPGAMKWTALLAKTWHPSP